MWGASSPREIDSWRPLARDLAATLEGRGVDGVIGVGHSLGGVLTAWAASSRPGLFACLVLIDPVLLAGPRAVFWRCTKRLGLEHRLPLIRATRRRRDRFPDRETARAQWSRRPVFAGFDPRSFTDYVEAALTPHAAGGVTLAYPKAWEARIFELTPHDPWPGMVGLDMPVTALAGATSDTFLPVAARRLQRVVPRARVEVVDGTSHFLPFERPERVARMIATAVDSAA
jgi:pimeloyl-ACP methyl ester carboxylesterase